MSNRASIREVLSLESARLTYHRCPPMRGPGRPLILLHPWFGCWQFWDQTVAALPEYDCFSVDLYSLGASPGGMAFAQPQGLARATAAMIQALGLGRCSLIGNSMGGIAAQIVAAELAHEIEALVLVGTGARTVGVKTEWREALDRWLAGPTDHDFTESLVAALLARRPQRADDFDQFVQEVTKANKAFMGEVLNNAFQLDLRPMLPRITAPTLVIRGELDAARTSAHVTELLLGIPDSRAIEIQGGGHSPQVDSPEAFTAAVRNFLLSERQHGSDPSAGQ
jgi:3-oxoadipate enol-lactonase